MVTDSPALEAVAYPADGLLAGLGPGKVLIDMSTVSPAASRALAEKVRERGADMVDSPVSGSVLTLEQGNLTMMVGGNAATFERIKPMLLDIGPKATHVGDNGLAVSMKIAVNLSLGVQMLAFSEGVLLAEKSGIARQTAVEVLTNSAMASPMVKYRGPFVLELPEEVWFSMKMMQKDMMLALEMGHRLEVPAADHGGCQRDADGGARDRIRGQGLRHAVSSARQPGWRPRLTCQACGLRAAPERDRTARMHHYGHFDERALAAPPLYDGHSHLYRQAELVSRATGSVHTGLSINELSVGGSVHSHVHAFEESFYILSGEAVVAIKGDAATGLVRATTPQSRSGRLTRWRACGASPVRWLQMAAPQPKPAGAERDTFFSGGGAVPGDAAPLDLGDLGGNLLGHFDVGQIPPPSERRTARRRARGRVPQVVDRREFRRGPPPVALHRVPARASVSAFTITRSKRRISF